MSILDSLPPIAAEIAKKLQLQPLAHEGGLLCNTLMSATSSAIYFMVAQADFSALHRLDADEVYHFYAGDPLQLLILHPDGSGEQVTLGANILAGEKPQHVVPAGCYHGSYTKGAWSLVGTTMSPPFSWDIFTLAEQNELIKSHPQYATEIKRLTRQTSQ